MSDGERHRIAEATALILLAMFIVPAMDGIAKELSTRYDPLQSVWARFFFQCLIVVPFAFWRHGLTVLRPGHVWLQVARALLLVGATALFFTAIASMPLADALALVFAAPLFVTALSPFLLKERVGPRRWAATLVGFGGALLIIQPGSGVFQTGSLLAFGAGASYAGYLLFTRRASDATPAIVTLSWSAFIGMIAATALAAPVLTLHQPVDILWMALLGMIGATAHFFLILAYARAPASYLAPFGYAEIVSATMIGYFWFGDFPTLLTWAGIAVIMASGAYISFRERQLSQ